MEHIASGHMKGGSRARGGKDLFPESWTEAQVERAVREAYRCCEKRKTQGERVLCEGTGTGLKIHMWVNTKTATIETAYPQY